MTARPFVLGAVPGATPGKWIATWRERLPTVPLELRQLAVADQRDALLTGSVDAALVRQPIVRDTLHLIPLYDEVPVVVSSIDSHLTAADELTFDDLAGEVLFVPDDAVLDVAVPGAVSPSHSGPLDIADAIATVAAGTGVVIVPMSLARLHHRRDVTFRPLRDGPTSSVGLAWLVDPPDEAAADLIQTFIGIVRGRSPRSSRR